MTRILGLVTILVALLLMPSSAAANSIRIPQSAAEWASYTPEQQAAYMDWVWKHAPKVTKPSDAEIKANTINSVTPYTAVANGGVSCGITVQRYAWGKYVNGWAQAYAYQTQYLIDTGYTNRNYGYYDTFYRNGSYVHSFGVPVSNSTVAYAQSIQDFSFPWEALTYSIQAYGSAQLYSGYFSFKLVPCYKAQGV